MCIVRGLGRVHTLNCAAAANRSDFAAGLIRLFLTELSARELALKYKQLWQVEATFRTMKTALATRPIYHKRDDTIRGHVFCSFLALVLRDELQRHLAQRAYQFEWGDILQDLERLQQIELTVNAKGYRLRTDTEGCVAKVFQACGVALPPQLEPA